jgi:hypothetical protein
VAQRGVGNESLELAVSVAQAEVAIQAALVVNLDTRGATLLAVTVGLVAIDVTLGEGGLGHLWWIPLIGLVPTGLLFIVAISALKFGMGPHLPEQAAELSPEAAYRSLRRSFTSNGAEIRRKERMLFRATWLLVGTVLLSVVVLALAHRGTINL